MQSRLYTSRDVGTRGAGGSNASGGHGREALSIGVSLAAAAAIARVRLALGTARSGRLSPSQEQSFC